MEDKLAQAGIPLSMKNDVFHLIDRVDKLSAEEWNKAASKMGLESEQTTKLSLLLKNMDLWQESPELVRIFTVLERLGVRDYVKFDPRIIRGLDYYTGTVFEAWDVGGDGRAVLGGGHYDNLVEEVGGNPLTGVGFAMGDVMISILLRKYGCIPEIKPFDDMTLVTVFDEENMPASVALSAKLRDENLKVICYPEIVKLQKQLKYADRLGVRVVAVLGPDEIASGSISIKNLQDRTQVTVPLEMAGSVIRGMLAPQ